MTKTAPQKNLITVNGIDVHVVRKDIKNLHLAVYPPDGRVRVAAPKITTDDNVRLAVITKLSWIKKQQKEFRDQPRQSERRYVSGECYFFQGKRYRLEVIERQGSPDISFLKSGKLKMYVKPQTSVERKDLLINEWYRTQLKACIADLLNKWQPLLGKKVSGWGVRKMKTKWGSCNIEQRRIWLNLELAKKPLECLEYILVHELLHFYERNHNERFKQLLDQYLPDWRFRKRVLNTAPLAHEDWVY